MHLICATCYFCPALAHENEENDNGLARTGIVGLDQVLNGGLPRDRVYLIEGEPGSGKTTVGLQFLREGAALGERCLYVTLSETEAELQSVAASHGWSLDGVEIFELLLAEGALRPESNYTVFEPAEVELGDTVSRVLAEIERVAPSRLVIDSLAEFRLQAQSALRYRRQVLALKDFFAGSHCTVLLLDDRTTADDGRDLQLHSIANGVIALDQLAPEFGGARRRLRVVKLRARDYSAGFHDFRLARGGLQVFPRLVSQEHKSVAGRPPLRSGVAALDTLMGGGVDHGTATMLIGPAGSGKSTLAIQYACAAAAQGERGVLFLFDERPETLLMRATALGLSLPKYVDEGLVSLQQVDPAELSPGEFGSIVQASVEPGTGVGASFLVIDSLNGYMQAMSQERYLLIQLHELLTYLARRNVATFLVVAQHGLVGPNVEAPFDASYLADTVVQTRFFEADSEIRQAISVLKRRTGNHERVLREFKFTEGGVVVGKPLVGFHGLLTGVPTEDPERRGSAS